LQKLIDGVHQFQTQLFGDQRELFQRLAAGQHPEALFITCSDSRINPNLLTQTAPGELFIIRNAGNIIPPYGAVRGGEAATIEFAVAGLGIHEIIICGHSHCGAMSTLVANKPLDDFPALREWLGHAETTRRIAKDKYTNHDEVQLLNITIQENVLVQLENIRTHPVVASGIARGQLHLHAWVYKIETGEVFAYDPDKFQFVRLKDCPLAAVPMNERLINADMI
jgi:carbonic anhydrase